MVENIRKPLPAHNAAAPQPYDAAAQRAEREEYEAAYPRNNIPLDESYAAAQREMVEREAGAGLRSTIKAAIAVHRENLDVTAEEFPLEALDRAGRRAAGRVRDPAVRPEIESIMERRKEEVASELTANLSNTEKQRAVEAKKKAENAAIGRASGTSKGLGAIKAKREAAAAPRAARVQRLAQQGISQRQIAERVGIDRGTVARILRRNKASK